MLMARGDSDDGDDARGAQGSRLCCCRLGCTVYSVHLCIRQGNMSGETVPHTRLRAAFRTSRRLSNCGVFYLRTDIYRDRVAKRKT